jgi:hypothetical protein
MSRSFLAHVAPAFPRGKPLPATQAAENKAGALIGSAIQELLASGGGEGEYLELFVQVLHV